VEKDAMLEKAISNEDDVLRRVDRLDGGGCRRTTIGGELRDTGGPGLHALTKTRVVARDRRSNGRLRGAGTDEDDAVDHPGRRADGSTRQPQDGAGQK
jgi:hypothetical protein